MTAKFNTTHQLIPMEKELLHRRGLANATSEGGTTKALQTHEPISPAKIRSLVKLQFPLPLAGPLASGL